MGRARFKIPDKPADRPKVPEVVALVRAYYEKPGNGAGGHCHVVLDDSNLTDGSIRFCLDRCFFAGDSDGVTIMCMMLQMTRTQRRHVVERAHQAH